MNPIVVPSAIVVNTSLALQLLEFSDAEALFRLIDRNRAHLLPWFDWVLTTQDSDDTFRFVGRAQEEACFNSGFHYGIWYDTDLVGVVGTHTWERHEYFAELYYWLDAAACGKGLMTVSCQTVVDWLFEETETGLVQICCEPQNERSARLAKRLGFTLVNQEKLVDCSENFIEYVFTHHAETAVGQQLTDYFTAKGYDRDKKGSLEVVLDLYQQTHESWCHTRRRPPSPD